MLPAASLVVHLLPIQPDHIDQQPLGQPMLPHHSGGTHAPLGGQLQMTVTLNVHQVVTLHSGNGLRHGRATLMQALGNPRSKGNNPLLLQLIDGAEIHLGGVDQVAHPDILHLSTPPEPCRVTAVLSELFPELLAHRALLDCSLPLAAMFAGLQPSSSELAERKSVVPPAPPADRRRRTSRIRSRRRSQRKGPSAGFEHIAGSVRRRAISDARSWSSARLWQVGEQA
jgi:hypothetical protein